MFGITNELAGEMAGRRYDMVKTGSLKMKIETKPEFKSRLGKSPDLADAAFLCIDIARQRLGLVAAEPIDQNVQMRSYQSKSMKNLTNLLVTQELVAE